MLKTSAFLTCILLICSVGTLKAEPPDSPDVVYIDGRPCNQACQSYMAWSRSLSERSAPVALPPQKPPAEIQPIAKNTFKQAAPGWVARQNVPKRNARPIPDAKLARVERASGRSVAPRTAAMPAERSEPATAVDPKNSIPPVQDLTTGTIPDVKLANVPDAPSTTGNATANGPNAPPPATQNRSAAVSPSETPPQQTAAQPLSEEKTKEERPDQAVNPDTKSSDVAKAIYPDNTKTAAVTPTAADPLVAVLLVRKEIKSIADLANRVVAIDASDAVSRTKTAIVSAGGAEVQLSEGARMALLRVMDGEVQAAVVTLESPEKAAVWTEVPGFNVLRLPLAPSSERQGPG
jgi:hypothetical protein